MRDGSVVLQPVSFSANRLSAAASSEVGGEGHFRAGGEAVFGLAPGTGLSALRGGMAETLPTGLGPTAGGIMTSRPAEGLETAVRVRLTVGDVPLAGLRGRGL